jgi:DDE family transposase
LGKKLEKVIASHTAGCPVKGIHWTYLNIEEIRQKLTSKGLPVCREVVYRLLDQAGLGRRKMTKQQTMKSVEGRNEQFERIHKLKQYYLSRGYAVLSIDVKKKEYLGAFYRSGKVYSSSALPCYDHDFNSFSSGKMVPHGILDIGHNEGYLFLGISGDPAEFNVECIRRWWNRHGKMKYDNNQPLLLLCDGGGSNGSRSNLFKAEIQKLSNEAGLKFRVAHYPSYCSKYNPIEHRLFPAVTRAWSGIMLDSVKTAKKLLNNRPVQSKPGLRIVAHIVQRTFLTGKKLDDNFWNNSNINFDKILPKWNYRICPIS